jgi:hypothetical protein
MIVMSTSISDRMPGPSKLAMPVRSRSPAPVNVQLRGCFLSSSSPAAGPKCRLLVRLEGQFHPDAIVTLVMLAVIGT